MKYNDNRDLDIPVRNLDKKKIRIKNAVKIFKKYVPKGSVLDVGTRDGYTVEYLNKVGYEAGGIEILKHYVEHARKKGRNVMFGDIMDISTLPNKKYDAIFSRHSIEHCRDAEQFMKSCEYLLKDRGVIFIVFPLENKKMFERQERPYHMVYFPDEKSFLGLIKKSNFRKLKIGLTVKFGMRKRKKKELLFIGEKK